MSKKFVSMALAALLLVGSVTPAFAAQSKTTTEIATQAIVSSATSDKGMITGISTKEDGSVTLADLLYQPTQKDIDKALVSKILSTYTGAKIVCNDALNMRSEPDGSILRQIRAGKVVKLINIEDGWLKVSYGTATGYVSSAYCELVDYADYEGTEAVSTLRDDIIAEAMEWLGTPYRMGGSSKKGTDCSGFTLAVFGKFGYSLTHGASDQYYASKKVDSIERQVGDLVFFSSYAIPNGIAHVGIYIGNGQFIHASSSRGVIISSLSESYYSSHYYGSGNILD